AGARRGTRAESVRVRREGRAEEDGYSSGLIPGVRASADARRLAQEIAFSAVRLNVLDIEPPGLYGEAQALASSDLERASWICFLLAYLAPLEGQDPFAGVREVLEQAPTLSFEGPLPTLEGVALGPRSSHVPGRGADTLVAYRQWVERSSQPASQASALVGDASWSAERRFERLLERLTLPGLGRAGRYELLVTLGRLGLFELHAGSLHLAATGPSTGEDPATVAAKRVFGIGDPLLLDRRAGALAEAVGVPVEALDLALFNWGSAQRASAGVAEPDVADGVLERAEAALGI
ncbi:MAG: hypothetical protein H0X28_04190, partial [Solirubrobacterales bacterium]|nr:hypothetical protein [Solirubrobacterales bacterium]